MKVVIIVGARPNFIKVAPLMRAIAGHNSLASRKITPVLVHTGQHYDYAMSEVFFEELGLPEPDIHLGIGSGTHAEQTGRTMIEVEKVLVAQKPDLVMVVGDVNATLAAALAAAKLHLAVAHVEAGIRSFDKTQPEEINRRLTDHISDYLFTTSSYDDRNLLAEGIAADKVFCVGNIMADTILANRERAANTGILARMGLSKKGYALVTLHRPANVDGKKELATILKSVAGISQRTPVVFPVHPRTRQNMASFGLGDIIGGKSSRVILTEPLGYLSLLDLEMNARMVITDSGGIQVETTVLGVPCLTLLDTPVWPITHDMGTNILVGSDPEKLENEALRIIEGKTSFDRQVPPLWDGKTAERIVGIIAHLMSCCGT